MTRKGDGEQCGRGRKGNKMGIWEGWIRLQDAYVLWMVVDRESSRVWILVARTIFHRHAKALVLRFASIEAWNLPSTVMFSPGAFIACSFYGMLKETIGE